MSADSGTDAKRAAGRFAADIVRDGSVIGVGTGSTVLSAIERLAERIGEGARFSGVPTSYQTQFRMQQHGIPVVSLDDHPVLDFAIDGADQVNPQLSLIKGRGGALVREKCVSAAAREFIVVVDDSKLTRVLSAPVPIEVIPFALGIVTEGIRNLGGTPVLREGTRKDGPVISDNGNFILDCGFGQIEDPSGLEQALDSLPGVLGCGIFSGFTAKTRVVVAGGNGCQELNAGSSWPVL